MMEGLHLNLGVLGRPEIKNPAFQVWGFCLLSLGIKSNSWPRPGASNGDLGCLKLQWKSVHPSGRLVSYLEGWPYDRCLQSFNPLCLLSALGTWNARLSSPGIRRASRSFLGPTWLECYHTYRILQFSPITYGDPIRSWIWDSGTRPHIQGLV